MDDEIAVVGGTGYTGREIVSLLLKAGHSGVRVLTGHPDRPHPFGSSIRIYRLEFDDPSTMHGALRGVRVLYNTYWVRFRRGDVSFERAVSNTARLFEAAREEGVERVVHISITNPSLDSAYGYFRGKAAVEEELKRSGLSYAILRPTIIFGREDILINNMAWIIRRFRFFPVFGSGEYKVTPVYVGDVASACIKYAHTTTNVVLDCVGPETYTFKSLLETIARAVGVRALIFGSPKALSMLLGRILSLLLGEPVVTEEEVGALMDNLLYSSAEPLGSTRFSEWVTQNSQDLGVKFASEIQRHYI
ncbi:hypothetical protein B9Q04_02090 [Candidatus Marsarchaeota G2 archaeon BE_D]|jgi:uncharacterized protein YbjT (DUF2867 family)|uniref:NAD(P)-binding domain-containing protein n=2 Tax=Candidatus Marsarchaeota group 2 TaxID=2203771 RepID=A0A2R6CE03_9ARCH|nr:MAG: hypothetical protein B9Q06_08855 [Candidatus Marsarchaeota G2 archaeon ECH_B_2]PSO09119.1 MAG: hypothetical protein B9Q04_02090 [Candidatus Marsarchaeota G2 archaeon BE_D]